MKNATSHAIHNTSRLDYLDGVRAFALLLGIVFHASLSFMPIYIGWAVMDISTSNTVGIFMLISHSFRMELFFLIAGFFSHMTFHGKGAGSFLASRCLRIAVPFIIFWFILRPLLVAGWIMGAESMRGEANIAAALLTGFSSLQQLPAGIFTSTHLWFLYYLLLLTAATLLVRYLLALHAGFYRSFSPKLDALVRWFCQSRFNMLLAALPTASCLWFMSHWGMDTPDKSLAPHLPVLIVYSSFFMFGWLLHRQANTMEHFARLGWPKIVLTLAAIIAAVMLSGFEAKPAHRFYHFFKGAFLLSYALMMWSLVALSIGLFKRFFSRPNPWLRYLADASYWLYLIHLPIVVFLQVAFAELELHWLFKLSAISVITIAVSLIIYDLLIRNSFIGVLLNGRRRPRALNSMLAAKRIGLKTQQSFATSRER